MTDPTAQPATPRPGAPLTTSDDKLWASLAHLGGIVGVLPSLIIWLVFKDRGRFTDIEGKEAVNFQITLVGIYLIGLILSVVFIGLLINVAAWIAGVILSILAFMKAKDGINYRYPFAIRLIK